MIKAFAESTSGGGRPTQMSADMTARGLTPSPGRGRGGTPGPVRR